VVVEVVAAAVVVEVVAEAVVGEKNALPEKAAPRLYGSL
jgi:hypothetical protein